MMDISSIAGAATAMKTQQAGADAAVTVLRKTLDVQAAGALSLLQALPQPVPAQNLPAHLGQNLNVVA